MEVLPQHATITDVEDWIDRNECCKFIVNGRALPGSAEGTGNLCVQLWASKMIIRPNEWYSSSMQVSSHSLD